MHTEIHTERQSLDAPRLEISANLAPRINVAFHQNSVPAIGDIELVNPSDAAVSEIELHISAIPEFLKPKILRFDSLVAGGTRQLSPVPLELDPAFLLKLTETMQCELRIEARSGDQVLACSTFPVTVLAPNEWTGLTTAPELVAAFVRPNDPAVDVVLRKAAEKLGKAGFDAALDGYSRGKKERVWQVANAIWSVLSDERIVYALPPQSFERNGQKVRVPSAIFARKLGTCLDLSLLLAACLEQAGFHALVGFSEGHAFCGVWLKDDGFSSGVIDESQILRKRLAMQDLILIETTLLTNTTHIRLVDAVAKAAAYASETPEKSFELLVDIKRARQRSIRPLSLDGDNSPGVVSVDMPAGAESELDKIPTFTEEFELRDTPDAP